MSSYLPVKPGNNPDKTDPDKVKKWIYEHVMIHNDRITKTIYLNGVKINKFKINLLQMLRNFLKEFQTQSNQMIKMFFKS